MKSTLGAPSLARFGSGQAGSDTSNVRPTTPSPITAASQSCAASSAKKNDDDTRRCGWESLSREIDLAWQDYRDAGKTEQAWQKYRRDVARARRDYIIGDLYYLPIESD